MTAIFAKYAMQEIYRKKAGTHTRNHCLTVNWRMNENRMGVYTETNIGSELYSDDSILLNSTAPLFMVVAEKKGTLCHHTTII
jgi:hypothetical protein